MGENNIFNFGVSFNFKGNYKREGERLKNFFSNFRDNLQNMGSNLGGAFGAMKSGFSKFGSMLSGAGKAMGGLYEMNNRLLSGLFSLRNLVVGGGITYGFNKLKNSIMHFGREMEDSYARIFTAMGSEKKTLDVLAWARERAVDTPFDLPEINHMISNLALLGKTHNKKEMEKYFQVIGDFAGAKALGLDSATQMITRATRGDFRWLKMRFGIDEQGLAKLAQSSPRNSGEMMKQVQIINSAAKGTEAYADAVLKLFGLYTQGGMEKMVKTVGGGLSNISDLWSNFMIDMIGYSQVEGTLFNKIAKSLQAFLGRFDAVKQTTITMNGIQTIYNGKLAEEDRLIMEKNGALITEIRLKDRLFRLGKNIGKVMGYVWEMIARLLGKATDRLEGFIEYWDAWFGDFRGNVAPLVVFLSLLKDKIIEFGRGFKDGFLGALGGILKPIFGVLGKMFGIIGADGMINAERLGEVLGKILGTMIAIKAVGFVFAIPMGLLTGLTSLIGSLTTIRGLISAPVGKGGIFSAITSFLGSPAGIAFLAAAGYVVLDNHAKDNYGGWGSMMNEWRRKIFLTKGEKDTYASDRMFSMNSSANKSGGNSTDLLDQSLSATQRSYMTEAGFSKETMKLLSSSSNAVANLQKVAFMDEFKQLMKEKSIDLSNEKEAKIVIQQLNLHGYAKDDAESVLETLRGLGVQIGE